MILAWSDNSVNICVLTFSCEKVYLSSKCEKKLTRYTEIFFLGSSFIFLSLYDFKMYLIW